jgi:AraC-like DNA-binding protein
MNNRDIKPAQTANQDTLLTLHETLSLDWQRIMDRSQNDKTHQERVFRKFIQLVESSHQLHRSPKFYADKLGMTKSNLRKICQQEIGVAPSHCIHARLMLEACVYLKGPKAIKEIASELAFEDPSHFSKFFKSQCGLPPDSYRKFTSKNP